MSSFNLLLILTFIPHRFGQKLWSHFFCYLRPPPARFSGPLTRNVICGYSKEMDVAQKTEMLQSSLKLYLGFQFLLTSPSPFVPPGTPNMRVMFYDFLNLTNEGVMRHIEGCVVQGGDVVGFRRRPLNVSTHLAAIFSSVREILSSLPTPSLSVV